MDWEQVKPLYGKKFRRIVGVHRALFEKMVNIVTNTKSEKRKHPSRGNASCLSIENQVLMTVLFWREYRTQEHIGISLNISQSSVSRIIRNIEDILIKSGDFSIPGKKALSESGKYETIIVDVTESPTERPKKNKNASIAERKNVIQTKP